MSNEAAQNIIVMERPVHNSIMLFSSTHTENTFIMMCESYKINSVIFIIVSIYFPKIRIYIILNSTYSPFSKS